MKKRIISILLVLSMIVSMLPVSVFAEMGEGSSSSVGESLQSTTRNWDTNGDGVVNIVTFGASNVNGFGLDGYLPEEVYESPWLKNDFNIYGYKRVPAGSYPDLLAKYLMSEGYTVEIDQLAMSSMRAEEVRFMFDENYDGDAYTDWRFTDGEKWFFGAGKLAYAELNGLTLSNPEDANDPQLANVTFEEAVDALRKVYQKDTENADIVIWDVGINNFGVYLSNRIVLGEYVDTIEDLDPELAEKYEDLKSELFAAVEAEYGSEMMETLKANNAGYIMDAMAYCLVSYCINYDIAMEKIYKINSDVTVINVTIQNLMKGLYASIPGMGELPLGDIVALAINAANTYMGYESPFANKGYYANVSKNQHVTYFIDQLAKYNGDPTTLDEDMINCWRVYNGGNMLEALEPFVFDDEGKLTCMPDYEQLYYMQLVAIDAVAKYMKAGGALNVIYFSSLVGGNFNEVSAAGMGAITEAVAAELGKFGEHMANGGTYDTFTLTEVSDTFWDELAVANDIDQKLMATFAAYGVRTFIGNAFYAHPNRVGHVEIFEIVRDAFEKKITGPQVIGDNAYELLEGFYLFLKEDDSKSTPEKVDLLEKLYSIIKGNSDLADYPEVEMVEEIYRALKRENLITDDQTLNIVLAVYGAVLSDRTVTGEEMAEIADFIYGSLVYSTDDEKVSLTVIGVIGVTLQKYGYVPTSENNDYIALVEALYIALSDKGYLTDAQTLAIVDFVFYSMLECGDVNQLNIRAIIAYVYEVLFNWRGNATEDAFDLGDLGEINNNSLTDIQKLDIILTVYQTVSSDATIIGEYPEVEAVGGLLEMLIVPDDNGEYILEPEKTVALMQSAMDAFVLADPEDEEASNAAMAAVTEKVKTDVVEAIKKQPLDKQLELLTKVTEVVDQLEKIQAEKQENGGSSIIPDIGGMIPGIGGGNEDSGISMKDVANYLTIAQKVIASLREEEIWGDYADGKYASISAVVFGYLMGTATDEIDPMDLAMQVYDMLLGDPDLTIEKKIQMVIIIYNTLAEDPTIRELINIPTGDEAYDYVTDLRDEVLSILDANWTEVIDDLYDDLKALYADLDAQTKLLNNELYELVNKQQIALNAMIAERDALLAELEALKAQLEELKNGQENVSREGINTYGLQNTQDKANAVVEELEAAIAETEAAIAELDASIQALTNKIESDLLSIAAVEAAITQIKAEIAETESALADVIAAIDQLNADLKVVYEAALVLNDALQNVYALVLGNVDGENVAKSISDIIETVPAIIEDLKSVYDKTQAAMDRVESAMNILKDTAEKVQTRVDSIIGGVEELTNVAAEQMDAIRAAAEACKVAVDAVVNENRPAVEKALENTYTELEEVVLREVDNAMTWFEENQTVVLFGAAAVGIVVLPYVQEYVDIRYENGELYYGGLTEAGQAIVDKYTDLLNAEINKLRTEADKAQEWLDENLPKAKEELDAKLTELAEQLKALDAQYQDHACEEYLAAKAIVMAEIEKLEAMYDQLIAKAAEVQAYFDVLQTAIAEAELALNDVIAAANVVGNDLMDLLDALTKLHAELVDLHDAVVGLHDATIDELRAIFGYCGIVADNFVNVLKTLPNYVNVLIHAVELVTSNETWAELDDMLQKFIKDVADRLVKFLSKEETQSLIKDLIAQYGPVVAEKVLDTLAYLAEEYGHDVAVSFYNYLYNNPDEVIAFFNEYGDDIAAMVEEYGDVALALTVVVFYMYGEDIVDYVIENRVEIFTALANWTEIHGENMVALIQVYAEALGLCDVVRDQIAILENAIAELEAEAKAQIAVLEAQIAELKAQLETADAELKAQIEAQIAELEAKIEALKGEVAVKIAEVKAAIAELEAALEAVIEKGFTDVNELVAAVMNLTKAVNELVVAVNELAIERLTDAVNKVQEALVNLDNTLYQMIGETYNELKALLWMAVEDLVNQIVETVKKYHPEVAGWIYDWLYNNPEKVIAFFVEYGEDMFDFVNEYIEEIAAVMAYLAYNFGDDVFEFFVDNAAEIMQVITRWMDIHGEKAWELVEVYLDALGALDVLESIDAHVAEKIAGFEAALKELYAQLDALKAQLEDAIASGNAELAAKLEAAIAKVEAEIAKIEAMIAQIMAVLEKLGNDIADIYDAINEIINIVDSYADWDVLLPLLRDAFNKLIDAVISAIDTAALLETLETALNKLINEGMDALVDYLKGLGDQAVSAIAEAMEKALRKLSAEVASLMKQALNSLVVMVNNAVTNVITGALNGEYTVSNDSHYVAITGNNSGYMNILAECLWLTGGQFTNMTWNDLDYEELEKADLITIGYDENNLSSFAVEQLFGFVNHYLNVTVRENTNAYVERVIGKILSEFTILDPEMFATVPGAVNDALDQVLAVEMLAGRTMVDMDWAALIGEENLHYVDELRADLKEELLASGIPEVYVVEINVIDYLYENAEALGISDVLKFLKRDALEELLAEDAVYTIEIPVVDAVVFAAESYVYGVLEFNANYAKTVMTLQQINPDVALVVLGNYNAFRNVELTMGDVTLDLGEAYEKLAEMSSIHPFAYAVLMSNVTYVDIMDVETNYEAMVKAGMIENNFMNFLMLYLTDGSITEASAAGNVYIAEQIMKALNVTCDHVYDDECTDAICNRCGAERTVGHSYGEWIVTNKPTCTEAGEETRECFCGATETREVKATGHSFTNYVSDGNATCTEDGTKTAQCDNGCGETDTVVDEGSMLDHNYENGACTECGAEDPNYTPAEPPVGHTHTPAVMAGVAATCTTTGLTEGVVCASCNAVLVAQKVIPALGHTEEVIPAVEATCTTAGLSEGKKCSVCGETLVAQEEAPALGHTEEVIPAVEATCTTAGLTEGKKCSVCGETLVAQEETAALGHKYESVVVAPTCTNTGYTTHTCSVCGHSYKDSTTAKREHKWDAGVIVEEPTCTKLGVKEIKCIYDDCDASFLDKLVPALGHTEEVVAGSDATCTKAGLTEGKKCSVCGETLVAQEEIPAKGHSFGEWTVTKEATTKEEGEETRTCACGETETRTIEKLTKDDNTVTVVITLGSITGVGGIATAAYFLLKKKRIF